MAIKKGVVSAERTTGELIDKLGEDIDKCFRAMDASFKAGERRPEGSIDADYECHARQLIRAIFAFIEAVTFSAKIQAIQRCDENKIAVSMPERYLAGEIETMLTDKGEVNERPARIRLVDNIRFAFALLERTMQNTERFNANVEWWSCLKSSIKVRDRITHPKLPDDIDISGDEIIVALTAFNGFKEQMLRYAKSNRLRSVRHKRGAKNNLPRA